MKMIVLTSASFFQFHSRQFARLLAEEMLSYSSAVMRVALVRIRIRIRKSFIAKCVCTHKEFVLVLGASSTETIQIKQTTV